jgi:hypothetical protein
MKLAYIQNLIYEIRGQKIMFDFDLADMYETETKQLKRAVKRNLKRFPPDFMFQLTIKEYEILRCQIGTSRWGGRRILPFAFTEQGIAMLSSILNSERAIQVNILIMRIFSLLRQHDFDFKGLKERLTKLERKYKKDYQTIFEMLKYLSNEKQKIEDFRDRQRIGFRKEQTE